LRERLSSLIVVSVLTFLLFSAVSPAVMAQGDNNANYVTENQFQSLVDNINNYRSNIKDLLQNKVSSGEFENLSQAFQSFKDNAITQSELESEIDSLSNDLSSQISDLSKDIKELKQKKRGQSLMLVAYGEQMKFLTFGGFGGGGMNPMMLMMMQGKGGGGMSSMFQMKKISTDTPVMIMNSRMEMVPNAKINAYARGENGVMPVNIPTAQGITFFPVEGRIFGSVSAPGYEDTSFFVQVGEGGYSPGGGGGQRTEVSFSDHLFQVGESNVVSVTEGGSPVELDSISVSGPKVDSSFPLPSQGKIQFTVGKQGMYTISWTADGQSHSRTFATEGYERGGGGGGTPWAIYTVVIVGIVLFAYTAWRLDWISKVRSKFGGSKEEKYL